MRPSVTLLAFGRKGYAFAGANLVASLRHYGYGGDIDLFVDARCRAVLPSWVPNMATLKDLPKELGADPCAIKLALPDLIEGPTLYMDVDTVVVKDITPWFEALHRDGRPYITCVYGKGKDGEKIEYFVWARTATAKAKHALRDDATFYGIQSSWAYMRPGEWLKEFRRQLVSIHAQWDIKDLLFKWGQTMPDELFYSLTCTVMDYDPSWDGQPMFWGRGFDSLPEIKEKYYAISLWGSGKGKAAVPPRHVEKYDAVMRTVMQAQGRSHDLKSTYIRQDKYVDQKTR